jgi:ribosomal protein L40E
MPKVFQNNLEKRVNHDEYVQIVATRKRYNRATSVFFFIPGVAAVFAVVMAPFVSKLGSYTNNVATDIIALAATLLTGSVSIMHAKYLWNRYPCRFCLKDNPEGATYCMSCGSDLLSNENLPGHKKYYED